MSRLVMIPNPHPGGTYIWVVAPDDPVPAPQAYVTEIWCPAADEDVQRLHSPMKEPEPEAEL